LPRGRYKRITFVILAATAGALAASWALNYLLMLSDSLSAFTRSAITATVLPLVLVPPLIAFGLRQQDRARRAQRANVWAAGRDLATGFVSHQMLTNIVEERRKKKPLTDGPRKGAFLLLDISELKSINAQFGPEWSASALSLVADTIRKSVREGDLVGRLETGEFGIFLPDADEADAQRVGQRINEAVGSIYFAPGGIETIIALQVVGVIFDHQVRFAEVIRHAAQQFEGTTAQGGPVQAMRTVAIGGPN
jgi:diguanylate cyclase